MIPLQSCTQAGQDLITQFRFIEAISCTYTADIGLFTAGLMVWGAISLAIYTKQGSAIIPAVLLFQFGGVAVAQTASIATPVVVALILVVPAGLAGLLYYRYSV